MVEMDWFASSVLFRLQWFCFVLFCFVGLSCLLLLSDEFAVGKQTENWKEKNAGKKEKRAVFRAH